MKAFHFIYKTTCIITGKFYIGMHSTNCVDDGYLGSGLLIQRSIKAHGRENHLREILEFCGDRKALRTREREIITEEFIKDRQCMNVALGGTGGIINEDHREAVLSGWKKRAERIKTDPVYREEHAILASKAGKIGGKKGAEARVNRMKNDPGFAEEYKRKMSEAIKRNWEKRRLSMSMLNAGTKEK